MDTQIDLKSLGGRERIVYVRAVDVADLPEKMRPDEVEGLDKVYAVHSPDGARLALVKGRELAFQLALQNDFLPVTVH